jgi:hypothetical protein
MSLNLITYPVAMLAPITAVRSGAAGGPWKDGSGSIKVEAPSGLLCLGCQADGSSMRCRIRWGDDKINKNIVRADETPAWPQT